jgi:hypothetical protein
VAEIYTNTTKGRWWQDRRFNCTKTTMCVLEENGEAFRGELVAHTDTFMTEWCVYDYGKYVWVATEEEARAELLRRYNHYKNKEVRA